MQIKKPIRTGFTIVEMAIVILVMGILAAAAAPTYLSALDHYRVEMAASRIVADLRFARSEAIRSSRDDRYITFESGPDRYTLVNVSDINDGNKGYYVYLGGEPFYTDILSATFGANENVTFDRFGRPDDPGTVVVRSGSEERTVTMAADGTATR